MINYKGKIKAHSGSEISNMIKVNQQQLLTAGYDGYINLWDRNLKNIKSIPILTPYINGLYASQDGFYVGIGTGEIIKYDINLNLKGQWKIHDDIISHFLEYKQNIITLSYDGTIKFINHKMEVCKSIAIGSPITQGIIFQEKLYLASIPAYKLDLQTFKLQKIQRYQFYAIFNKKIYGCSDDRGFTCISKNTNTYVPCQYMLPLKDRILVVSQESIGFIFDKQSHYWKLQRNVMFQKGYSIKAGVEIDKDIYLASESGYIYKFGYN